MNSVFMDPESQPSERDWICDPRLHSIQTCQEDSVDLPVPPPPCLYRQSARRFAAGQNRLMVTHILAFQRQLCQQHENLLGPMPEEYDKMEHE